MHNLLLIPLIHHLLLLPLIPIFSCPHSCTTFLWSY
jgi:hypothetical protein